MPKKTLMKSFEQKLNFEFFSIECIFNFDYSYFLFIIMHHINFKKKNNYQNFIIIFISIFFTYKSKEDL